MIDNLIHQHAVLLSSEAAVGDWFDSVYLSHQPTLDGSQVSLDSRELAFVGPHGSYTRTIGADLSNVAAGSYYLIVVTNDGVYQAESDLTNNVTAVPTTVLAPQVDLVINNVTAPASVQSGQAVMVTWTVANQGTDPADKGWYDSISLSPVPTFDSDTAVALLHHYQGAHAGLAGGASYVASGSVLIPTSSPRARTTC